MFERDVEGLGRIAFGARIRSSGKLGGIFEADLDLNDDAPEPLGDIGLQTHQPLGYEQCAHRHVDSDT
jgi:hypothetical protein